jgi:hypothetical protein
VAARLVGAPSILLTSWLTPARALEPPADPAAQLLATDAPVVVVRTQASPCSVGEPCLPTVVQSVLGQPDVVLHGPGAHDRRAEVHRPRGQG